jgi:RimK family alpha-L-glutamate ligase
MMRVVILSARTGWHTDELTRALTERGHLATVVPYERLTAGVGIVGRDAEVGLRTGIAGRDAEAGLRTGIGCSDAEAGLRTGIADPDAEAGLRTGIAGRHVEAGLQTRLAHSAARFTSEQISLLDADAVLARIIPGGSLEQLIFRVDALHWIENRGVRVVNPPRAIERSVNKFYTTTLLHDAGLPVPETVVCERAEDAMAAVRAMGDVVIKPIFGSLGHGMVRVSDPETALRVVRALEQIRSVFYVQRAIDHGGHDLRVFVVGGRVIGVIERRAPAGEWRTNVAIGGAATAVSVDPDVERVALAAAAVVGADYAGVDVLPARDGSLFVLEVNGIPGWQGLQRATGIDVAGSIVEHVERCVRRGTGSERPEEPTPA